MIEDKKHLARSIVGAGEQWIAGLRQQLAALVALDADTAVSEGH